MSAPVNTARQEQQDRQRYDSPLPAARPTLVHALASEWTKLVSVRSTLWTLASLVVLVVGIGSIAVIQTTAYDYEQMPFTGPAMFGLLVGQVSVIVLGVLSICSEYGTGLIRTTLTAAPDRYRVLTAKYVVFGTVALGAVLSSVALVGFFAAMMHSGAGSGVHTAREWLWAVSGSVYVTVLGVLALAVGALVRHSAGGIAVMLGVVTVPPVLGAMLGAWEATRDVGQTLVTYSPPVALIQLFGADSSTGSSEAIPSDLAQLGLVGLVTAAAVAGSYLVVGRRDV
ncbi:ABC transporter permease [Streptomyces venezuelae]|uniref:ABC transporter permease n=1 Tax=Streptomyces venezuelae TaxID=54571 RepID=A0A5P2CZ93_STRVZ|nr:ABC transporter permease subunit [Streptomyces venezuelae]QES48195.1 ABC transporter permease [Streptomyces venezuelae]